MRQANGSPLPTGVKFFIWPRYVLSVQGIEVRLSRYRARILMLLMSRPEAVFSTREIARAIYWDRDDGGAWATESIIPTQVFGLLRACRDSGVDLRLKKPGVFQGYAFMSAGLTEQGMREVESRTAAAGEALPRRIEPLPSNELAKAEKALRVARRIARDEAAEAKPPKAKKKRRLSSVIPIRSRIPAAGCSRNATSGGTTGSSGRMGRNKSFEDDHVSHVAF